MWQAFKKFAESVGFTTKDTRKKKAVSKKPKKEKPFPRRFSCGYLQLLVFLALFKNLGIHFLLFGRGFVSIDCELPSIHKLRWNELLHRIALEYHKVKQSRTELPDATRYTEKQASDVFSADMIRIYNSKKRRSVIMMFDEIERISPCTGSSEHWKSGEDFVYFWQTMRGFYQRHPEVFTYMVVGTNPSCIEVPLISGHENPLFGSIPCLYVPSFTVTQVREMVRKLGKYMGLKFDELIYSKLTEDFGGHPFLIRQMCSIINGLCPGDRPADVDKALYQTATKKFAVTSADYMEMIIQVLRDWYPDEYDMLRWLSTGDAETFNAFAADHARYTKHLIGYGLLQESKSGFAFNIEEIRKYIEKEERYQRLNLTDGEKLAEISERRNKIEKGLRVLLRGALKTTYGKSEASKKVTSAIPEKRRDSLNNLDVDFLLSKDSSPLFFLDLINIVNREWAALQHVFEMEKSKVLFMLAEISESGRPDAHAKVVTDDEFGQLRLHFNKLESLLEDWGH